MSSSTSSRRRGRRSPRALRSPAPGATAPPPPDQEVVAAEEDDELVSRLRALLPPDAAANGKAAKASSTSRARVLQEACVYIRRLHAEVDGAAERLARLLEEDHPSSVVAAVVNGTDAAGAGAADELMLIRNLNLLLY